VLRTPSASQQQALRARIVLRAAEGATNTEIAAEAGVSLPTVGLWRRGFSERGFDGLQDAPRSGRPREIDDDLQVSYRAFPAVQMRALVASLEGTRQFPNVSEALVIQTVQDHVARQAGLDPASLAAAGR